MAEERISERKCASTEISTVKKPGVGVEKHHLNGTTTKDAICTSWELPEGKEREKGDRRNS